MNRLLFPLLATAALTACSDPEKTGRYLIDPPIAGGRVANVIGSAELRDVSLPEYASGQEVAWQTADGAVRSNPDNLWADNPQRAFTQSLARAISDVSGANVIAEPWPMASPPAKRIEVRVEKALAQADGVYRMTGRYFVSSDSFDGGADRARSFDIAIPFIAEGATPGTAIGTPAAIANAQSLAIAQLARQIATYQGS